MINMEKKVLKMVDNNSKEEEEIIGTMEKDLNGIMNLITLMENQIMNNNIMTNRSSEIRDNLNIKIVIM